MAKKNTKSGECLRAQPDRLALAQQPGGAEIEAERSEDDFRHVRVNLTCFCRRVKLAAGDPFRPGLLQSRFDLLHF